MEQNKKPEKKHKKKTKNKTKQQQQQQQKNPVFPLTGPILLFRADWRCNFYRHFEKKRKIYSPTNPFFAWQFLTEVYVNVRIANKLH